MANLIDILKKAATGAVARTVSNVKSNLKQGQQIAVKQNQFEKEKAAYENQVAAIKSAPYTDAVVAQKVALIKKPVAPTFITAAPTKAAPALNLNQNQLKDVSYYEKVQKAPLSKAQLDTYLNGNTPTLNAPWYQQLTAAARDTVNPLFQAADRLNTTTKFTNPALYQDNEVEKFKQAQSASNAAGANAAWQTAKFTNPILRGMSISAPALGNAVGAVGGDTARETVNPIMNAYYKYNPKYIAGNLVTAGLQGAADTGVNLFTGKDSGVNGLINDSDLSPEQKDMASTLYQAGTNLAGAAAQKKFTNSKSAVKQQLKNDAQALKTGWETFKKTGSIEAASDAAFTQSESAKAMIKSKGKADVLGFRTPEQKPVPASKLVKERQVNLSKFSEDPTVQAGIKQQIADAKKDTYVKKSFQEMEAEAKNLAPDIQQLLKKSKNGLVSAEENLALTQLVSEQQKLINELKLSPRKQEVQAKIDQAQSLLNHALDKQLKGGTAVGRALVSNRYLANITLDPEYWLARGEKNAGGALNDKQRAQIDALARQAQLEPSSQNKVSLAQYVAGLEKPSLVRNLSSTYKAALIFSPKTWIRNAVDNKALSTLETIKDIPASIADRGISLLTGKRGTVASPSAFVKGKVGSIGKGLNDAKEIAKTGLSPLGLQNTYDVPRETRYNNPLLDATLGKFTRASYKMASLGDAPFKRTNYEYSLRKQAEVEAINQKVPAKQREEYINNLVRNPSQDMKDEAMNDANIATYQTNSPLANAINRLTSQSPAHQLAGDIIMPFKQIPINVYKTMAVDYSPLGTISSLWKARKQANMGEFNQKQLSEGLGRSALGSGILAAGYGLGALGAISPSLSSNTQDRDMQLEEGKSGNSVSFPGTGLKADVRQMGTPGRLLSLGADINDIAKQGGSLADTVTETGFRAARTVSDQPFMQGLSKFVDAFQNPEGSLSNYASKALSGLVPPLVNNVASILDTSQKNPSGIADTWASRIPGLRDNIPDRVGIFGQSRKSPTDATGWANLIDPFNLHVENENPILNKLRSLDMKLGTSSKSVANVKMSPKEYETYQTIVGQTLGSVLSNIISVGDFDKLSAYDQSKVMKSAIEQTREIANDSVFPTILKDRYQLPQEVPNDFTMQVVREVTSSQAYNELNPSQREQLLSETLKLSAGSFQQVSQDQSQEQARDDQLKALQEFAQKAEQEAMIEDMQNTINQQQSDLADSQLLDLTY